jgi:vacuolar-type H+-ATPase subunit I/STV1
MAKVQELLAHFEDIDARQDAERLRYEAACAAVLTPEQQRQIAALTSEYKETLEEVAEQRKVVEEQLKQAVLLHAQTVKGSRWRAEVRKGRVKWDTKALETWFKGHDVDAMDRFRTEGQPTVALVQIREKAEKAE